MKYGVQKMDAFLLSINPQKARDTLSHLDAHGFTNVKVVEGVRPPRGSAHDVDALNIAICKGHWKCTNEFAHTRRSRHVIIFEEDCRFITRDPCSQIGEAVDFLDKQHPQWGSLHIGHCPLGFIWPVIGHSRVWRTLTPVAGHCYVLNGDVAVKLISAIPSEKWIRPYMVEKMRAIKASSRYAIFPSIAMQNHPPKEMRRIMGSFMTYETACRALEFLWLSISISLVMMLVFVVYLVLQ